MVVALHIQYSGVAITILSHETTRPYSHTPIIDLLLLTKSTLPTAERILDLKMLI